MTQPEDAALAAHFMNLGRQIGERIARGEVSASEIKNSLEDLFGFGEKRKVSNESSGAEASWADLTMEADRVIEAKGRDYTKGSDDRLANFRTAATDAGISPLQAWLVFMNKHHAAICSYVKTNGASQSEPIKSRFVDMLNYLRLGWMLVKEEEAKRSADAKAMTI